MADLRGLSCSVCYNNFKSDEVQFIPRNLICGHTYCTACLNKLAFQARNPGTICCPTCKTETPLFPRTFESVRNLPKNFGVLEILESKEEGQTESIQQEKEKNKYLCPEHDEALKVYCYTCNCLICIYCQVYGKHEGHRCELATDIVTTTREELRSWSKKLADNYDLIKKSRKKVIDTKDSIVTTQQYLRNRIMKHMGVLNACMRRREVILKCDVDDRTKRKLELLDAQESLMSDIVNKCEEAYNLIQRCQNNESALVEEKINVRRLVDDVSALLTKCELEPVETNNLTYYFEYDIQYTLENTIGEIRLLKPGQKEEPLAGLNKHELSLKKETKEASSQTYNFHGDNSDGEHPLFESLLQGLQEIVQTGLTPPAQSWENSPALELHVHETDSSESSGSESHDEEIDDLSEHSDIVDNEEADGASVGDEDNDEGLEGAVGGAMLFSTPERQESQESPNSEREQTSLLDELQKEIDRLRLLNPGGEVVSLVDESPEGNTASLGSEVEVADGPSLPREPEEPDSLPLIRTYPPSGHQPLSLPCFASLPGQSAVTTDSFSRELTRRGRNKCSVVNCRNPASLSHLKCKHCCRTFCLSCSVQYSPCPKNRLGSHSFVPDFSKTHLPRSTKKRVEIKKAPKEEAFPWECKRCTMLNGPQVLVCLGCEALRETEAQEGRNVCPMCTLVNEPGKTKCELCETLLVKQEEQSSPDD